MVLPNDTFRIRDAHPEETNDVVGVITEAYREYMPFIPAPFVDAFRKDAVAVQDRSEYTELIVAERGSQIVGTVTFYPDGSRYGPGLPDGSAAFRLLAVVPEARGLGVGRALTLECLRRAGERGVKTIVLHTTMAMAVARQMYERMGFWRAPELDVQPIPEVSIIAYRLDLQP